MYRPGKLYDELDQTAIQILLDYGFFSFPLDEKALCRALGVALVPYSEFELVDRELLKKRSLYGFFVPEGKDNPPTIFYNDSLDDLKSPGCIRQTVFHEIKHYVFEDDDNPDDDDLAEHFGRYLSCPTPLLVVKRITNPNDIIAQFGTSATIAENIASSVRNRLSRHGMKLFDYEKPLIERLEPLLYKLYVENAC